MSDVARFTVRFDPSVGSVVIESGGPSITIDNLPSSAVFLMQAEDDEQTALYVSQHEADVLIKTIRYVLDKVKITDASRAALNSLVPRLEEILGEGNG